MIGARPGPQMSDSSMRPWAPPPEILDRNGKRFVVHAESRRLTVETVAQLVPERQPTSDRRQSNSEHHLVRPT